MSEDAKTSYCSTQPLQQNGHQTEILQQNEMSDLERIKQSEKAAWDMYDQATIDNDSKAALQSMGIALDCMKMRFKLEDEGRAKDNAICLEESAEWQQLMAKILKVLDKFPDAHAAMLAAIANGDFDAQ